ncbi:MAG: DUF1467 family protein [Pseudomonadota bacterium]
MNVTGAIVVFVIIWWLVFFAVLPRGVRGVWEDDDAHADGVEQGAPADPQIWRKVRLTTFIATPLSAIVVAIILSGVIDFYN